MNSQNPDVESDSQSKIQNGISLIILPDAATEDEQAIAFCRSRMKLIRLKPSAYSGRLA